MLRFLPLLFCLSHPAQAQTPSPSPFTFPLACTLGVNCSVLTYQDTLERPGDMQDPFCGKRTRDNQVGTIFALPNVTALADPGVAVKAIGDGQIEASEMRWPDGPGKGCGNGVIIRHKGGWTSRYCGLRHNSSTLEKGAFVTQGQTIGLAGLTGGQLPWPGLYFTLSRYGRPYDLWTGKPVTAGCKAARPLIDNLLYQPLAIIQAGVTSPNAPLPQQLINGVAVPEKLTKDAPLVAWAQVEGLKKGDEVRFTYTQNGQQIWQGGGPVDPAMPLVYARRNAPPLGWKPGPVLVTIEILRQKHPLVSTTQSAKIN